MIYASSNNLISTVIKEVKIEENSYKIEKVIMNKQDCFQPYKMNSGEENFNCPLF